MASCYDCIHCEACSDAGDSGYSCLKEDVSKCKHFKNKADFVEVVRCERCEYKDDCARQMVHTTRDYILEQNISTYNIVDFCSYGKPKNDKE